MTDNKDFISEEENNSADFETEGLKEESSFTASNESSEVIPEIPADNSYEVFPDYHNEISESTSENSEANSQIFSPSTSGNNKKKPKKEKNRRGLAAIWTLTVLCLIVSVSSAAVSVSGLVAKSGSAFVYPQTNTPTYETAKSAPTDLLTVSGVSEKVSPSTVMITAEVSNGYQTGTSMGSGFFITTDGVIVTNYHVIENARSVSVTTNDGTEYQAKVLGSDSTTDIAVLKVEGSGFVAAELGDSSKAKVGDQIVAIGTPYDSSLQNTVTSGYVSAIRNNYRFSSLSRVLNVIQHDAAINSGNSGGPLCNMYGQVIGINSVKVASDTYENIGFAIQISSVSEIITELINNGSVDRPMIGITATTDSSVGGARVVAVAKGSPADSAGVQKGDIITKVDGQRVTSTEELINYFSQKEVGDTVEIVALRDAESITLKIVLFSTNEYNELNKDDESNQNENNQNSQTPESYGNNGYGQGGIFGDYFNDFFN